MRKFPHRPYPFFYKPSFIWRIGLYGAIFGFLFLYFFEPFNVNKSEHKFPYVIICLIHTGVVIGTLLLFLLGAQYVVKQKDQWNLGKEIGLMGITFVGIGVGNFLIRDFIYDNPYNWTWSIFFEEILHAFLVGALLYYLFLSINFVRLKQKHEKEASHILLPPAAPSSTPASQVSFPTHTKEEIFTLDLHHFIFAKAEGNYVEVYSQNGEKPSRTVIRYTLKEMEEQLKAYDFIFRTHRSFLVNLHQVKQVSGNAQGLEVVVHGISEKIPVARGRVDTFSQAIQQLSH